jgi:hypothetical protein
MNALVTRRQSLVAPEWDKVRLTRMIRVVVPGTRQAFLDTVRVVVIMAVLQHRGGRKQREYEESLSKVHSEQRGGGRNKTNRL